ncbi:MAG TPA: ester cyclase [bacterium]|nr:ester cyclase [bacterium]
MEGIGRLSRDRALRLEARMTADENKAIVLRWIDEAVNKGNLAVAAELVAADCIEHNVPAGSTPGREGTKQRVAGFRTAFPDLHVVVEDVIAEGDKVVTRWAARGTHKGPLMGIPPTNKQASWVSIHVNRLVDGQITEDWHASDLLGVLRQLGVFPAR